MIETRFVRADRSSSTLRSLVCAGDTLDEEGVRAAIGGERSTRSIVAGIERHVSSMEAEAEAEALHGDLEAKLSAQLDVGAFALSGGVDAALLLALAVRRGRRPVAYTLRPRLCRDDGSYDEHAAALAIGRALGVEVIVVDATDEDFVEALPDALRAIEVPLYNLHPVARLLLARRVAADGHTALVTGDGADQRCARRDGHDYLPLVAALTRAAGLSWVCPYLHPSLVELDATTSEKPELRALLARDLAAVAATPKRPRLAPSIALAAPVAEYTTRWLRSSLGLG
ncbi:MAG: asparagine synthase-related protein [Polyangia bacterium]